MGAFSTNVPCLDRGAPARVPSRTIQGRRIGTGTDLWRMWDERPPRDASNDVEWRELEAALTLGKGTCNTMGTAPHRWCVDLRGARPGLAGFDVDPVR